MTAKDTAARLITSVHRAVFNASNGKLAGRGMGMRVVKLTTTGRKTGQPRDTMLTTPLIDGERIMLVASYGGDDREPAWCLNIRANPAIELTMAGRRQAMTAHIADAAERAELWPRITAAHANYAGYARKTDREIPVVVCAPAKT